MNKVPIWAYASAAATLLIGVYGLSLRHKAESSNKAVGFAAEAEVIQTLGELDADPDSMASDSAELLEQALVRLKAAGLTAVTVSEQTVNNLVLEGQIQVKADKRGSWVDCPENVRQRLFEALGRRFANVKYHDTMRGIQVGASPGLVLATPIGLDPLLVSKAKAAGLPLIVRHANYVGAKGSDLSAVLAQDKEDGALAFLPMGDTLFGFKSELSETVEAVRASGLQYITVEFGKTPGDSRVREALPLQTIRMHSIQGAEMDKLTPADVKERFVKAARERQMRWLLLRPQSQASADPVGDFAEQIRVVRKGVEKEGLTVRVPHSFPDFAAPAWYCVLLALAALPGIAWLILQIPVSKNIRYAGIGAVALLALGCWLPSMRGWFALLAATSFPILAYFHFLSDAKRPVVVQYLLMALIAMAGGVVVSATLIGPQWMLQNKLFVGPKLAHYLPILVAGILLLMAQVNLREVMKKPLIWGTTLAAFGILAALLFMQTRLGNDNPAGVSGLELKFRSIMDALLYVRPRTKEFLIGNPALFIGIALWNRGQKMWGSLLLGAGAIGLTSIVNTFCHLHTPIELSVARIGIGLALGGIIGAAVWGVLSALLRTREGQKTA